MWRKNYNNNFSTNGLERHYSRKNNNNKRYYWHHYYDRSDKIYSLITKFLYSHLNQDFDEVLSKFAKLRKIKGLTSTGNTALISKHVKISSTAPGHYYFEINSDNKLVEIPSVRWKRRRNDPVNINNVRLKQYYSNLDISGTAFDYHKRVYPIALRHLKHCPIGNLKVVDKVALIPRDLVIEKLDAGCAVISDSPYSRNSGLRRFISSSSVPFDFKKIFSEHNRRKKVEETNEKHREIVGKYSL